MKNIDNLVLFVKKRYETKTINDGHVLVILSRANAKSLCKRNVIKMITIKPYKDIVAQDKNYSATTFSIAERELSELLDRR